jgi:hypothetical protein
MDLKLPFRLGRRTNIQIPFLDKKDVGIENIPAGIALDGAKAGAKE